mgnify:CR=1 FL=1
MMKVIKNLLMKIKWTKNKSLLNISNYILVFFHFIMSKFSTIKEIFELFVDRRKFHMFPIVITLIALIGVTALAQSGLVAFIYPI